jgi:hypothetical protein
MCSNVRVAKKAAPYPYAYYFQDPATPIAEGIMDLHHDIFF